MLSRTLDTALGFVLMPLFFLIPVGSLYWIWMAIQLGSFGMFVIGIVPPAALFTAPIGLYSLLFGAPQWLMRMFG